MLLKTGFGYYVEDGKKTHKFVLSVGEHEVPDGCDVVEVANQDALDKIVLDKSDEEIAAEKSAAVTIKNRTSAIAKLKAVGLTDDEIKALVGG